MKVKGWKKIFHANGNDKKLVVILMLDKTDFKRKAINRGKEGHYIMKRGSIQEEGIKFTDIYAPNIGVPKYTQKILTNI